MGVISGSYREVFGRKMLIQSPGNQRIAFLRRGCSSRRRSLLSRKFPSSIRTPITVFDNLNAYPIDIGRGFMHEGSIVVAYADNYRLHQISTSSVEK
jgi:hypothetical protein